MRLLPIVLLLAVWGCSGRAVSEPSPTPVSLRPRAAPVVEPPADHRAAADIRALIEQLAISQERAGREPIYTPSLDTTRTDKRVVAYEAAERLVGYGVEAFPYLLRALKDNRQSVGFRRLLPSTVGDACYTLITRQLYALPEGYAGSIYRTGKDGKLHGRPVFDEDLFEDYDGLERWLRARKGRSLEELQLEALGWVLAEEKRIGVSEPDDEQRILRPLREKVRQLEAAVAARGVADAPR